MSGNNIKSNSNSNKFNRSKVLQLKQWLQSSENSDAAINNSAESSANSCCNNKNACGCEKCRNLRKKHGPVGPIGPQGPVGPQGPAGNGDQGWFYASGVGGTVSQLLHPLDLLSLDTLGTANSADLQHVFYNGTTYVPGIPYDGVQVSSSGKYFVQFLVTVNQALVGPSGPNGANGPYEFQLVVNYHTAPIIVPGSTYLNGGGNNMGYSQVSGFANVVLNTGDVISLQNLTSSVILQSYSSSGAYVSIWLTKV